MHGFSKPGIAQYHSIRLHLHIYTLSHNSSSLCYVVRGPAQHNSESQVSMFSMPTRCPIFFLGLLVVTSKAFLKVIFVSYVTKVASSKGLTSEAVQKPI